MIGIDGFDCECGLQGIGGDLCFGSIIGWLCDGTSSDATCLKLIAQSIGCNDGLLPVAIE